MVEVSYLPTVLVQGTLKYCSILQYFSVPKSTQTQIGSRHFRRFKIFGGPMAGVCLFKTFGNYTVVSVVRLQYS
jgi:hypothetical protein